MGPTTGFSKTPGEQLGATKDSAKSEEVLMNVGLKM